MSPAVLLARHTVRVSLSLIVLLSTPWAALGQDEEANKALARRFYEQVWFSRNPAAVDKLVAPTYVVHDIGDRKGVQEPADEQKRIAERLWQNGAMGGHIDFQIAEGDLVATRWEWEYEPRTWLMTLAMLGNRNPVPIINVFRFENGRIVEIWNHRHDIDIGFAANALRAQGFVGGVLGAVLLSLGRKAARKWRSRRAAR